jgi:voltage-gated potassium channel Kch
MNARRPADLLLATPAADDRNAGVSWRRRFAIALADYRWWVLAAGAVTAFGLGCIGFWQYYSTPGGYFPTPGHRARLSDIFYWSLKLFVFTAPDRPDGPVVLDIARFLAPIVASFAGLSALGVLFRDRLQQMRIPRMHRHVVMSGLGPYVGSAFLRHLWEHGEQVVVIESDAGNPRIELCRSLGVPVIVGDAQSWRTLHSAGVQRASLLLAVCPDDALNAEIISVARNLVRGRSAGALRCVARIGDPDLCALLRIQGARSADSVTSLDFFNTDEVSARLLLDDFPITTEHQQPHILVAHLDPLGSWVIWHAAREWHYDRADGDARPLVVTVVDDDAQHRVAALLGRYPELEHICTFVTASACTSEIRKLADHHDAVASPPLTRAYVTAYHDEQAVETALRLRRELDASVPLVMALARAHGVAGLITNVGIARGLNIDVFMSLERTCTVELLKGGSWETIAHAIHRRWRAEQPTAGKPPPTWAELDEPRKESSRAQALDIKAKVRSMGCVIEPFHDWGTSDFAFTEKEIEDLAIDEHKRWEDERLADGWTLGSKDVDNKVSPYLVPFCDLPPDIAELDRIFVRQIPSMLASVGLQVVRLHEAADPAEHAAP